jgi:type IV pilus assembly protein PilM
VQRGLGLPYELAEELKKGQDVDGATYEGARPVLKAMTDNILLEVEKTFDFFKATASNDRIDRIVLSGGASRVDGFAGALEARFGTEVTPFDPFRQVSIDPAKLGGISVEEMAPVAAVAVGLALRKAGDR